VSSRTIITSENELVIVRDDTCFSTAGDRKVNAKSNICFRASVLDSLRWIYLFQNPIDCLILLNTSDIMELKVQPIKAQSSSLRTWKDVVIIFVKLFESFIFCTDFLRWLSALHLSNSPTLVYSRPLVRNLFYTSYPFLKQDYQIYPQYTQRCWFIENTKLTNYYSLEWFIKIYIGCNLWFSKFTPLADEIYPRLRTTGLDSTQTSILWEKYV